MPNLGFVSLELEHYSPISGNAKNRTAEFAGNRGESLPKPYSSLLSAVARSLLDVLETKVELRAAPSLPGVRPTGITAKRMERIMKLGHGCHRHRPCWVVVVLLIGAILALPASAWTPPANPQENEQETAGKARLWTPKKSGVMPSEVSDPRFQRMTLPGGIKFTFTPILELGRFDVSAARSKLQSELKCSQDHADQALLSRLSASLHSVVPENDVLPVPQFKNPGLKLTLDSGQKVQLGGGEPHLKIVDQTLYAAASAHELRTIQDALQQMAKYGFKQFKLEIEIYELPIEAVQNLGLRIETVQASNDQAKPGVQYASAESAASWGGMSQVVAKSAARDWLRKLRSLDRKRVTMLGAPKLLTPAGQSCSISIGQETPFITSYRKTTSDDQSKAHQPVVQSFFEGLKLTAKVSPERSDESAIESVNCVAFEFTQSTIKSMQESTFELDGEQLEIQQPSLTTCQVSSTQDLQAGDFLVAVIANTTRSGGPSFTMAVLSCEEVELAPRAMQPLPADAIVGVSDQLSESEAEQLSNQLQQAGIKDWKVVDQRMYVPASENWKQAVELFQILRKQRGGQASLLPPEEYEQLMLETLPFMIPVQRRKAHAEAKLAEVKNQQIAAKLTFMSINAYKVLGPLKSGQTVARISPPSDDEILQAYAEKTEESRKLERASVTREYIGETADPKRFIPTLGDAVQHHSLYECMLFDEDGGLIDTIIVDHYHFHIGSEDHPTTQTPAGFRRFLNVQQIEQSRSSKDTCGT